MALHRFIRRDNRIDLEFQTYDDKEYCMSNDDESNINLTVDEELFVIGFLGSLCLDNSV